MTNNEYRTVRRRTALVAPGSDERKARKALNSTADEVILDLEDAVTTANKHTARELVTELVHEFGPSRTVSVRVNGPTTPWFGDDMTACGALGESLTSAIVPKVEFPDDLLDAQRLLVAAGAHSVTLQALIETLLGVSNVDAVTRAATRLQAIVIGYADLVAALGRSRTALPEHWLAVQDRILIACRTAGIAAIDGPFLGIADNDAFRHSAAWTSALGFDGKWVIHPDKSIPLLPYSHRRSPMSPTPDAFSAPSKKPKPPAPVRRNSTARCSMKPSPWQHVAHSPG